MAGVEAFRLFGIIEINRGKVTTDLKAVDAQAATTAASMGASFGRAATMIQKNAESIRRVGMGIAAMGAVMAAGLGKAVMAAAEFETQMRNVDSILKLSEEQLQSTSAEIIALSTRLPQSAASLAAGLYDIASSGFEGADGLKVLEASAKAASAGMTDTATAAQAIAGAINAYGMTADDAAHISDVLFKTVDRGVITFGELSSGIGQVLASAAAVGVTLEEVGAAIATMTKAGITSDMAMTSLNRIMVTFLNPPKLLAEALATVTKETGLQIIQTKGLAGAVEILNKVSGNSPELLAAMGLEQRSLRAAMSLTRQEGAIYRDELERQADAAGATQAALDRQAKAFAYQWGLMKNQITAAAIGIGQELIPALRPLVETLGKVAKAAAAWVKENPELTRSLVVLTAQVAAFMLALGPLIVALPGLVIACQALIPVLAPGLVFAFGAVATGAATAGEAMMFLAAPAGALALVTASFVTMTWTIREAIRAWWDYKKELGTTGVELTRQAAARVELATAERKLAEAEARAARFTAKGQAVPALTQADISGWKGQIADLKQELAKLAAARNVAAKVPGAPGGGGGAPGVKATKDALLEATSKALDWLRLQVEIAKAAGDVAAQHQLEAKYLTALTRVWEQWRTSTSPARAALALSAKQAADEIRKAAEETRTADEAFDAQLATLNALTEAGYDPLTDALIRLHPEFAQAIIDAQEMCDTLNALTEAGVFRFQEQLESMFDTIGRTVPGFGFLRREAEETKTALHGLQGELVNLQWALATEELDAAGRGAIVARIEEIRRLMQELANVSPQVAAQVSEDWVNVVRNIHDAFAQAFGDMMTGASSFADFLLDIWQAIERSFANMVAKMVADWLFGIDQMQATGQAGGVLGGIFNAAAGLLLGGGEGTAAATPAAGLPYEFLPYVPVYDRGGIATRPHLAQVGGVPEAIIPLSQMAAAGAGGGEVHHHYNINAVDASSFMTLLMRNRSGLASVVQTAAHENNPAGRGRR